MDRGLSFELLDNSGERLPSGVDSDWGTYALDDNETQFIQKVSIQASETLPGEITLRAYNIWENVWYDSHVLELH